MFHLSLKPGDWIILIAAVVLVVSLTYTTASSTGEPQVRIDGDLQSWLYPLDADIEIEVAGPLGNTHVHIHDGAVWVSDSPCRQKICIAAGEISTAGTFIACLPNKVLVRIEGKPEGEIDVLAF